MIPQECWLIFAAWALHPRSASRSSCQGGNRQSDKRRGYAFVPTYISICCSSSIHAREKESRVQISAEIRWFWPVKCPDGVEIWFRSGPTPPGGGNAREDEYLYEPKQTELGLKRRGEKPGVEAKGLVTVLPQPSDMIPFVGPIEIWCKWPLLTLKLSDVSIVTTKKIRWLRKFDTGGGEPTEIPVGEDEAPTDRRCLPKLGCNVELTLVEVGDHLWWTLGFEAFGELASVERSLRNTLSAMAARRPPSLGSGELLNYPAWLSKHVPGQLT